MSRPKSRKFNMNWERFNQLIQEYPGGQTAIAEILGIDRSTISSGITRSNMNLERFLDICEIIDEPPHTFIPRNHPPKKP